MGGPGVVLLSVLAHANWNSGEGEAGQKVVSLLRFLGGRIRAECSPSGRGRAASPLFRASSSLSFPPNSCTVLGVQDNSDYAHSIGETVCTQDCIFFLGGVIRAHPGIVCRKGLQIFPLAQLAHLFRWYALLMEKLDTRPPGGMRTPVFSWYSQGLQQSFCNPTNGAIAQGLVWRGEAPEHLAPGTALVTC